MYVKTEFNVKCDVMPVIEGAALDINEAILNGTVEDTGENLDYNGIEEPSMIAGRCEDVFESIDYLRRMDSYAKSKGKSTQAAVVSSEQENTE